MRHLRFSKRLLGAFLFLIVAGLLVWRGLLSSSSRTVRLADGRVLTIRQLTYGTNHEFLTGGALAKLIAPALPASIKGRTGVQKLTQKTENPTVVVWGQWHHQPVADFRPLILRTKQQNTAHTRKPGAWIGPRYGPYAAWPLENFPRRDPILHFEICEWDGRWQFKPVAEFKVPNPITQKFPEWKPEPYPIVKRTNGLDFSMINFSMDRFLADPWLTILRHQQLATGYVATFHVERDGRSQENWSAQQMIVRDATGNGIKSRLQDRFAVDGYFFCGVDEPLWSSEHAWKLETQFRRTSGFNSNELCTLAGIPIPISSTATQILADAEANGIAFIGAELQRMQPAPSMQQMRENLEIEPLLPRTVSNRVVSLAAVKDDKGRFLIHDRSYFNLDGMHFGIQLLPDSRTLDLTFAVQQPVLIEFTGPLSEPQRANR